MPHTEKTPQVINTLKESVPEMTAIHQWIKLLFQGSLLLVLIHEMQQLWMYITSRP